MFLVRRSWLLSAGAVSHPQLAFDEVLQRGVFADKFAGLHVFLAEAGEKDLGRTGPVPVVMDVEIPVRCLRDVGI